MHIDNSPHDPHQFGMATISCKSIAAGSYNVTIVGTSGSLRHDAIATFTFSTSISPDFTISSITPVRMTVGTTAASNVTVTSQGGFDTQVILTTAVYPSPGLSVALSPQSFLYGSGSSIATFSSSAPGDYVVTITGISESLSRSTAVVVAVTLVDTPDFTISASSSSLNARPLISGATIIIITPKNGFTDTVNLSTLVSPSGPTVAISSSNISGGSGRSTLRVSVGSDIMAGTYTVTVLATSASLYHSKIITVTVTGAQDVTVTTSISSLSFNSGSSGTATITVAAQTGFTGAITLAINAPAGVSCSLSLTSIQSSGTSTLTCKSSTAGDYPVTITGTGGASPHATTINVHVAAVSPAAPAPPTILGLAPAAIYGIAGMIIIIVGAGSVVAVRRLRDSPR